MIDYKAFHESLESLKDYIWRPCYEGANVSYVYLESEVYALKWSDGRASNGIMLVYARSPREAFENFIENFGHISIGTVDHLTLK